MKVPGFLATVTALPEIIEQASSASAAWAIVLNQIRDNWEMSSSVPELDLDAETENVVSQLQKVFSVSPPPSDLKLLYYGLYTGFDSMTMDERAGYYVAGTTRAVSAVKFSADLAGGVLNYSPLSGYMRSSVLDEIRVAALSNEDDYDQYDYGVMLCAAAILSCYASWQLGMNCRIVVGFDAGDAFEFPARTVNTRKPNA